MVSAGLRTDHLPHHCLKVADDLRGVLMLGCGREAVLGVQDRSNTGSESHAVADIDVIVTTVMDYIGMLKTENT